jgi:hypothetical protein
MALERGKGQRDFDAAKIIHAPPRRSMDTVRIIEELEAERDRLDSAISALQGRKRGPGRRIQATYGKTRHLSAAARRKIGAAMKKRWAERKKKQAA